MWNLLSASVVPIVQPLLAADEEPAVPEITVPELTVWDQIWIWIGAGFGWLYFILLVWMIVYCLRFDPYRFLWLLVMLFFQPVGAVIYFFVRWLPSHQLEAPKFLHRWTRRGVVRRLEVAAAQIGNAHQFVQLGDALREIGRHQAAGEAYARAIEKEPDNLAALWGAANIEYRAGQFAPAREKLERVLRVDPNYKFGDVSLLYGKALYELAEKEAARTHLEGHVCKWRQPEGLYLLAKICLEQQDVPQAREHLQALIDDIDSSPRSIARKFLFWKGRARRLLRRLPRS
jgi:hypothetical protein